MPHKCSANGSLANLKIFKREGVSYIQKFCGKHGFPNLANGRTSQFMCSKYLIEYQNIKVDSKIKI